jgi:hypothetical protein
VQPGAFGHEPSLVVAIGEYLVSNEFIQPRKTHTGGPGVLKPGWKLLALESMQPGMRGTQPELTFAVGL